MQLLGTSAQGVLSRFSKVPRGDLLQKETQRTKADAFAARCPDSFDVNSAALQRRLGKDVAKYLADVQDGIQKAFEELGKSPEYSIGVEYKLVLTKKPGEADIVLNVADTGKAGTIIQVAKDPSVSHPYRQKELVAAVNKHLDGKAAINQFDVQCITKAHSAKKRADWFYQGKVVGSPAQYSEAVKNWIVERFGQDAEFFLKSRATAKKRNDSKCRPENLAVPNVLRDGGTR